MKDKLVKKSKFVTTEKIEGTQIVFLSTIETSITA